MEGQRAWEYMGFDMNAGVDGDREHVFFIASRTIRSLTDDLTAEVPIDGIGAGRFPRPGNACDEPFDWIRDAIDKRAAANR